MAITNFRDIGGYETTDGLHVKHGFFYRSSPITFQTESDRKAFEDLHIKTILDLRSPQETAKMKDEIPDGCNYIHCSAISMDNVHSGNFDIADLIQKDELRHLSHYIDEIYKSLPFQNPAYQILFDLMRKEETPIVFHCSAGKDRTGFAAYLILKVLGVPDETIMHDYMLSNVYRREENDKLLALTKQIAGVDELLYVKERYLQSSMDAIAQKYSDFATYLLEEYGVTKEETLLFKKRYLE